jgi:hypothetical protein
MINLGVVKPGSTIYIPFDTFAAATGAPITITNFATSDIQIYKNGGTTQRASTTGFTLLDTDGVDFDAITGIQGFSVDLSSNATADFYNAGADYFVVVSTITVDGQTVSFVAARFTIGYSGAILDTTIATLTNQTSFTLTTGPAEDDALNGRVAIIHDIASAVQMASVLIADYTGASKTVTLAAGATFTVAAGDNISIMQMAPLQPATLGRTLVVDSSGLADANAVKVGPTGSGTAQTARDLGASVLLSSGTGSGQISLSSGTVTVGTNNDKTSYRLSATGVDDILDEAITEPSGNTFAWASATLRTIVGWLGALSRNKITQTSTTQTLRNDADNANISTSTHSDDGTTHTRGEWS